MSQTDRVADLEQLISVAKAGYENYKDIFNELNNAYLSKFDKEQFEGLKRRNKSRIFIPKINSKAKRMADALSETYFNNDTFAKLECYINSTQDVIDIWQEALDHYSSMLRLYKIFQPIFQKVPFLGTCVAKVYWAKSMPVIEEVELDNIFFDPDAINHQDIRYIVNKIYLSYNDIKKLAQEKVYNWKIVRECMSDGSNKKYERFLIYDIYEKIDNKWYVSSLYESSNLLRDKVELKDGQPFVFGYMLPQVRDFNESIYVCAYGEPPLASILPLQMEMNFQRNSQIDAVNANLKPKIIVPLSANITQADIETIGKPIFVSEPSAIGQVPMPNVSVAQMSISLIDNEMSEASGVSPQQNGASTTRQETATMASIMANEGSVRLQGYIRTFNETFFEPIFERLAMLVWKYGKAEFFAGYARDEIPSFRVSLNTGIGALNKEVQKQSLLQASQAINSQFGMCLQLQDTDGAIRMLKASEKIIEQILPLYGIKKASEFLGKENELKNVINEATGANEPAIAPPIGEQGAIATLPNQAIQGFNGSNGGNIL